MKDVLQKIENSSICKRLHKWLVYASSSLYVVVVCVWCVCVSVINERMYISLTWYIDDGWDRKITEKNLRNFVLVRAISKSLVVLIGIKHR